MAFVLDAFDLDVLIRIFFNFFKSHYTISVSHKNGIDFDENQKEREKRKRINKKQKTYERNKKTTETKTTKDEKYTKIITAISMWKQMKNDKCDMFCEWK